MKKFLSISLLFICINQGFAQDSLLAKNSFKPVSGEKVLTFGLINNSAFWAKKMYKENQFACRTGITGGYNFKPSSTTETTTINTATNTSLVTYNRTESKNFSIGVFAGVQKGFGDLERVEPYIGWDIGLSYSNSYSENEFSDSYYSHYKTTSKNPLNLGLAFMPLVGVNYFIAPRLAIGAEYRFTVFSVNYTANSKTETAYTIRGGDSSTSVTEPKSGNFSFLGNFTGQGYVTVTLLLNNGCNGGWCRKK